MLKISDYNLKINDELILSIDELIFKNKGLVSICGEIGCGKSSFAKSLIGFNDYAGTILYDNLNVKEIKINSMINYVPQNLEYYFLNYSIEEEILFSTGIDILKDKTLLEKYHLSHLLSKSIHEFSGGEKIRLVFLILELNKIDTIIFDETVSMNDYKNIEILSNTINQMQQEKLIIEISHDLNRIKQANQIIFIYNKNICVFNSYEEFKKNQNTRKVWNIND